MLHQSYLLPLLLIVAVAGLSIVFWIKMLVRKIRNQHAIRVGIRRARQRERDRKAVLKGNPIRPAKQRTGLRTTLAQWFSIKVFLPWLVVVGGWPFLIASASTDKIAFREGIFVMAVFMLFATGVLIFCSLVCISDNNWEADPRPFSQRAWVSGKSFVSCAVAFIIVNASLLLYGKGWL